MPKRLGVWSSRGSIVVAKPVDAQPNPVRQRTPAKEGEGVGNEGGSGVDWGGGEARGPVRDVGIVILSAAEVKPFHQTCAAGHQEGGAEGGGYHREGGEKGYRAGHERLGGEYGNGEEAAAEQEPADEEGEDEVEDLPDDIELEGFAALNLGAAFLEVGLQPDGGEGEGEGEGKPGEPGTGEGEEAGDQESDQDSDSAGGSYDTDSNKVYNGKTDYSGEYDSRRDGSSDRMNNSDNVSDDQRGVAEGYWDIINSNNGG